MKSLKVVGLLLLGALLGGVLHKAWHAARRSYWGKHHHRHGGPADVLGLRPQDQGLRAAFTSWAKKHNKLYSSLEEQERRFENFVASWKTILQHNSRPSTYKLDLTTFADLSDDEFAKVLGQKTKLHECWSASQKEQMIADRDRNLESAQSIGIPTLPPSVDWRAEGIVSPVKNQGHCGSCWAFSAVGALEAHYKKKYGQNLILSEQQLLDCSNGYGDFGCDGGFPARAFEYVKRAGGLEPEREYPYEMASNGTCRFAHCRSALKVSRVVNVTESDEDALVRALAFAGPVTVAFLVPSDFRLYSGGVYTTDTCSQQVKPKDLTHAVLAVGYGVSYDGMKYYIIKNSWGEGWGVKGYFLFERGKNLCGIADCASFPVIA